MCRKKACVLRNRSNTANGDLRRQNFKPHVEAREAEDGRRLLGFHTSEAKEEIRGVGFLNHQSTGNLWRHVDRRPSHMAAVSLKMEIELLGFANRRPKKRFATSVSRKYGEKTSRSEGRLELMVWRLWLLLLCLYSSLLNSGEGDRGGKDVSCIRIKTGGNGRNLNCRGSYPCWSGPCVAWITKPNYSSKPNTSSIRKPNSTRIIIPSTSRPTYIYIRFVILGKQWELEIIPNNLVAA